MNYNYPISIARKNALNFTFETKIRVTRFAPVKTLYLFNCKYPLEREKYNNNNNVMIFLLFKKK